MPDIENGFNINTLYEKSIDLYKLININIAMEQNEHTMYELEASINDFNTFYKRAMQIMNHIDNTICDCKVKLNTYKISRTVGKADTTKAQKHKKPIHKKLISYKTVETLNDVPVSHLYYVKKNNTYAINVNNTIIYGTLPCLTHSMHNTYNAHDSNRELTVPHISSLQRKTKLCRAGILCSTLSCQYYHDPMTVPWSTDVMEFQPISWLYTDKPLNAKNKYMRHVHNNPLVECALIDKEEYCRWNGQTMHNLLITLIIKQSINK